MKKEDINILLLFILAGLITFIVIVECILLDKTRNAEYCNYCGYKKATDSHHAVFNNLPNYYYH